MQRLRWMRAQWDRVAAALAVAAGLLALLLGWLGAQDTAYPAEQIPYVISGAVFGVILVGLGATAWLSADLRDEWRKLDRLEEILVVAGRAEPEVLLDDPEAERDARAELVVTAPAPGRPAPAQPATR